MDRRNEPSLQRTESTTYGQPTIGQPGIGQQGIGQGTQQMHHGTDQIHHHGTNPIHHLGSVGHISSKNDPNVEREYRERPSVIHERVLPGIREEIQPVIHRERHQTEIHQVTKPIYEKNVKPTVVQEKMLPPERNPEVRLGPSEREVPRHIPKPKVKEVPAEVQTVVKPTIVEETIKKHIIEEIQPVIHRETIAPVVWKETQPIYETVYDAPTILKEERSCMDNFKQMEIKEEPKPRPPPMRTETTETRVVSTTDLAGNPLHHHPDTQETGHGHGFGFGKKYPTSTSQSQTSISKPGH